MRVEFQIADDCVKKINHFFKQNPRIRVKSVDIKLNTISLKVYEETLNFRKRFMRHKKPKNRYIAVELADRFQTAGEYKNWKAPKEQLKIVCEAILDGRIHMAIFEVLN